MCVCVCVPACLRAARIDALSVSLTPCVLVVSRLAAAAGLGPPQAGCPSCIQGTDATPLLDRPFQTWKRASFSQYARCSLNNATGYYTRCSGESRTEIEVMGYSVRTATYRQVALQMSFIESELELTSFSKRWMQCNEGLSTVRIQFLKLGSHTNRYTEWFKMRNDSSGKTDMNQTIARELYNHEHDPGNDFDWAGEELNLAGDPAYSDETAEGAKIIREGWAASVPPA